LRARLDPYWLLGLAASNGMPAIRPAAWTKGHKNR
jgi:hypothetical protein